ncbi:MAG: biotin transporter BioY [Oscillospiraceae bacterium]|jgi:biotin transport system substrate-specific component|nr:biotin transporter BioY [Oscillospiraceae bacterium]
MRTRTIRLILSGLFAALLAVMAQLSLPLPSGVPLTMHTFAVALTGLSLGVRGGVAAVGAYLLLGAVGLPVFAGFAGGAGVLFGVTGGFLWGFLALAGLCGTRRIVWAAVGLVICHLLGVLVFALVAQTPLPRAFVLVSLPYLLKDALSVAAAFPVSRAVRRGLKAAKM